MKKIQLQGFTFKEIISPKINFRGWNSCKKMSEKIREMLPPLLLALMLLAQTFHLTLAVIGTGSRYSVPYTPNACYGDDKSRIPKDNMFAAAGEEIWDGGSACGRKYLVSCISSSTPTEACILKKVIQVVIVDRAKTAPSKPTKTGATFVLSDYAYSAISDLSATSINLEYQQTI